MGREKEQQQHSPSVPLSSTLPFVFVDDNMPIIGVNVFGGWELAWSGRGPRAL